MDFFASQDAARSASFRLAIAMAVAVVVVVAAVDVAALLAFGMWGQWHAQPGLEAVDIGERHAAFVRQAVLWITVGTLVVIAGGALMAWAGLRGGGRAVAESLGGREILHGTAGEEERRLLNVVEEMSLASGVPCPPAFVLEDDRINAFAAGFTPGDAAVAVTRGCLRQLSRDELQGVVAHEFSHILNGDMRLNMRLAASVAGLLAISGIGRVALDMALRSGAGSSSRDRKGGNALPFIVFAGSLIVIGWIGFLAGRLIQAAFSRQREFLADASAVQFTRNPGGIAGALSRIRGGGSAVSAPRASGLAHLFFADAIANRISGMFATHPPLEERIARITGMPLPASGPAQGASGLAGVAGFAGSSAPARATTLVNRAGTMSPEQVRFGAALLARLPAALAQAAREPVSARAVVLLPLLHADRRERDRQVAWLHGRDPWLASEIRRLEPAWDGLDADAARLPLLRLAAPALGAMSPRQRIELLAIAEAIARLDAVLTLREFCVLRRLQLTLSPPTAAPARKRLAEVGAAAAVLLGTVAHCAGADPAAQATAFAAGWARLPIPGRPRSMPDPAACTPLALGAALDAVAGLDAAGMRALVDACAHVVAADGVVNAREAELVRLACDALRVPMPVFADAA